MEKDDQKDGVIFMEGTAEWNGIYQTGKEINEIEYTKNKVMPVMWNINREWLFSHNMGTSGHQIELWKQRGIFLPCA